MKEYLEPLPNGDFRYHKDSGKMIGGDWIEIPEGAEIYLDDNYFYKIGYPSKVYLNEQWDDVAEGYHTVGDFINGGDCILWKREKVEVEVDNVNQPSHYVSHPSGIECIEITRHHDFAIGNAIKYLWRAGLKDSDNEVQDLEKAVWYIQDKIKQLKGE